MRLSASTEWGCAVRTVRGGEKVLEKYVHLEELALLAHVVLLACDVLDPLAMVCVRYRQERHL